MKESEKKEMFVLGKKEHLKGCCGEIHITNKLRLIFQCTLCSERFSTIKAFKKHVFTVHDLESDTLKIVKEIICDSNAKIKIEADKEEEEIDSSAALFLSCTMGEDPLEGNQQRQEKDDNIKIVQQIEQPVNIKEEELTNEFNIVVSTLTANVNGSEDAMDEGVDEEEEAGEYKCDECDRVCAHKRALIEHKRRHRKILKHECTECEKKYANRSDLRKHMLWHRGERPYICSWCGKSYRTNSALHIHERLHTNKRPYKCNFCEKDFYKNKHLKDHVVTHTQERNHVCHICSSRFPRRKALKSHIKIHENKREHVCNICQAAYNQRPALYLHFHF